MIDADSLGASFNDFIRDVQAFEEVGPAIRGSAVGPLSIMSCRRNPPFFVEL